MTLGACDRSPVRGRARPRSPAPPARHRGTGRRGGTGAPPGRAVGRSPWWCRSPSSCPLVFLVLQAVQVGWHTLHALLFRSLTAQLIWNTVSLTVVVTVLCALVGTLTAWVVERTDLPGAPDLGGAGGHPVRHPRLRGELRVAGAVPRLRRASGPPSWS